MKLRELLTIGALALSAGCAGSYHAKIDSKHSCERHDTRDFRLYENQKLLAEKVSDKNNVFDFYEQGEKLGRLNILPDGSAIWKSDKVKKAPKKTFKLWKKCEATLEKKYERPFLYTEE